MAKEHEDYGESMRRDTTPEKDEGCNAFYTRKQRSKSNKFAPDCEAGYSTDEQDRDAEVDNYKSDRDAGPMNYKRWDRYGRT